MKSLFKKAKERRRAKQAARSANTPTVTNGNEYGIDETKDLVKFVALLANGILRALKDGKFNRFDFTHLVPAGFALPNAFNGAQLIPAEVKDINEDERLELINVLDEHLDIQNEEQERLVIEAVNCQTRFVSIILQLAKNKKAAQTA